MPRPDHPTRPPLVPAEHQAPPQPIPSASEHPSPAATPHPVMAGARVRGLCAAAAVGTTSLMCGAVAGLFDSVGSQPWLADTPENRRLLARCEASPGSPARQRCVQQVIAERQQADQRLRLARGEAEPGIRSLRDDTR